MTRDTIIADLVLHGYVPSINIHGWTAIWNGETGRMCRFFEDGQEGPGWDVRGPIKTMMALPGHCEVPWQQIDDETLKQLTCEPMPPKFRHGTAGLKAALAKMDKYGVNSLDANGEPVYEL